MFIFPEQKKIKIGTVELGGQPGELPAVMVSTMFYEGHKIVKSDGGFDREKAEELLNLQQEKSDETKLPYITNVYGNDASSLIKRVEFVAENDENPIMIDSPSYSARVEAMKYAKDCGLIDRCVYNSLNITLNKDEKDKLAELSARNVLVLAHAINEQSVEDKISCLEKDGAMGKGLLDHAKEIGASNVLIDTATTPLQQGASLSLTSLVTLKAKYGLPVGCGIHNAVSSWEWIKKRESYKVVDAASALLPVILGADFVLYGPIENARYVFDVAAFAEILVEENVSRFTSTFGLSL